MVKHSFLPPVPAGGSFFTGGAGPRPGLPNGSAAGRRPQSNVSIHRHSNERTGQGAQAPARGQRSKAAASAPARFREAPLRRRPRRPGARRQRAGQGRRQGRFQSSRGPLRPAAAASVKRAAHSLHVEQPPAARAKAGNPPGIGFGFHPSQRQTEFARQAEGRNEILARVHTHEFKAKALGVSIVLCRKVDKVG